MLIGNAKFSAFTNNIDELVRKDSADLKSTLEQVHTLLADLVAVDDWLPEEFARTKSEGFTQYILYKEPKRRFSIISVAWAPGQYAPPHDHTVWGVFGQLRGVERTKIYEPPVPGSRMTVKLQMDIQPGQTASVSSLTGDIHDVENVSDRDSVSIHVYGGDLESLTARRSRYDVETGQTIPFVAEYR